MIVLAVLRHDQRLADMAGGNNVSESTVRRWRDELIALLAARAPRLDQGGEVVLIEGTLIATPRPVPGRPTGGTTPENTTVTACTSSP